MSEEHVYTVITRQSHREDADHFAGPSWTETHIAITHSADLAERDVRSKVRRQGLLVESVVSVARLETSPRVGSFSANPIKVNRIPRHHESVMEQEIRRSLRTAIEGSFLSPGPTYQTAEQEAVARERAVAAALQAAMPPSLGGPNRKDFENALILRGFKVVNARTGR